MNYWFIGSVLQKQKVNRFTISIYTDEKGRYYRHFLQGDIIMRFDEITLAAEINYGEKIVVAEHDPAIFCYTYKNDELLCGAREKIEQELLHQLFSDGISSHSKVSIASFLKLHGKTCKLIDLQQDSPGNSLGLEFDKKDFIRTENAPHENGNASGIAASVFEKLNAFHRLNNKVYLTDIALIQNSALYFDSVKTTIDAILINVKEEFKEGLNNLLSYSIKENWLDLGETIDLSECLFDYLLEADMYIEQRKVDRTLSEGIEDITVDKDRSVLEIGYAADLVMSRSRTGRKTRVTPEIQEEIDQLSFFANQILSKFNP